MIKNLQKAILVNIIPRELRKEEAEKEFDELVRLVETYGGIVILKVLQKRGRPSAKTFLGEGKTEEVANLVKTLGADMVIINDFLKANQSNNLVNIIPCEVLDRFELILLIFEKHASSPEAKLQIELMRMKYEFPKLFGPNAKLAQQKGGVRAVGGPGEKMLEYKRRHLKNRIHVLEEKIRHFRSVRNEQRARRKRNNFFTVATVGYTNSGKSTLLKALTKKESLVEDKLFSTLDTRLGQMYWPNMNLENGLAPNILISDTIGFMQNLPPLLFQTFLATLDEVTEADLLLHVVDISDPKLQEKIEVVEDVLRQLHCDEKPVLYIFNKIDRQPDLHVRRELAETFIDKNPIFISALQKENIDQLRSAILQNFSAKADALRVQ